MSTHQQLPVNDQSSVAQQVNLPQAYDSTKYTSLSSQINPDSNQGSTARSGLDAGTDVMGKPVNLTHQSGHTADSPAGGIHAPSDLPSAPPPSSAGNFPSAQAPAWALSSAYRSSTSPPSSACNSPSAQMKTPASTPAYQTGTSHPCAAQDSTPSPDVQTSSVPGATGKTPMDSIMQIFNKWSKKAEDMTGNVWNHLRTGPNVAETALGRIAMGTKALTEGGLENIFRQTFEVAPDEHLLKTYACYLSTSAGPVAGTLYISSHKLAFCSDRALAIPGSPPAPDKNTTTAQVSSPPPTANKPSSAHQQQQWVYYKIMVPVSNLQAVTPLENTEKKPPEKYVQVQTVDGHEFWFMGFVHYDKGVKNLQETLLSKTTSTTMDETETPGATSDTSTGPNVAS